MTFSGEGSNRIGWPFRPAGPGPESPEVTEDRLARRSLLLFAAALVVVGIGGLAYLLLWADDSSGPAPSLSTQGIGPLPGTELSVYTNEREAALDDASGERLAVVSLDRYVTEAEALATVGPVTVTGLLAAPPGGTPSTVSGSLSEWADTQSAASREERTELEVLLPTVQEAEFRDFYRAEVDRLTQVIDAVNPGSPLLFAVVVRAPAGDLRKLNDRPGIRLVDVGTSADIGSDATLRGLRPEETVKADDPPTRPL